MNSQNMRTKEVQCKYNQESTMKEVEEKCTIKMKKQKKNCPKEQLFMNTEYLRFSDS